MGGDAIIELDIRLEVDIMNLEEYNARTKEYRTKQEELQKRIDKITINEVDNSKRNFKK